MPQLDLIVWSHLRWSFVYQRPQHLLARLAQSRRVLFIEEPVPSISSGAGEWEVETPVHNVVTARLKLATDEPGFSDRNLARLAETRAARPELGARRLLRRRPQHADGPFSYLRRPCDPPRSSMILALMCGGVFS